MGLYVKKAKMPTDCYDCMFTDGIKTRCKITGKNIPYEWCEHNSDCPLTEIAEPHGDLIDRGAHIAKLEFLRRSAKDNIVLEAIVNKMIEMINDEPVVVEKTGGVRQ